MQELAAGSPRDSRQRVAPRRQRQLAPWGPDTVQVEGRPISRGRPRAGRTRGAPPRAATGGRPHSPRSRRLRGRPTGGAVARGAPRRRSGYSRWSVSAGRGPAGRALRPAGKPRPAPRPSPPGPHRPRLTPLRPSAGRLADPTPGTPSKPAPADPGVPCAPTATCPSGGPRLPLQAPTVPSPPLTLQTSPVSKEGISLFPSEYHGLPGGGGCGAVLRTSDPWGRRARRRKGREKWEETFLFQGVH